MKIIANGMVHHMAEAFMELQIFLPAVMTIVTLKYGSAIKAILLKPIMLFHVDITLTMLYRMI